MPRGGVEAVIVTQRAVEFTVVILEPERVLEECLRGHRKELCWILGAVHVEYLDLFMPGSGANDEQALNALLEVPLDTLISTYSTGMKRKLVLLGVLRLEREVLLLDEPTEGLAPVIVKGIGQTIGKLRERGFTLLMVEQNFRFVEALDEVLNVVAERGIRH